MTAPENPYGPAPAAPLDQVIWRVDGEIDRGGGVRVLPYINRVIVAGLLDEWVGPFNWRDFYETTGGKDSLYCHLEVRHPNDAGEWVRKTDVGTASNYEPSKGVVSDAFKRVCMGKWGVGRNVYDLPNIRLDEGEYRTYKNRKGEQVAALNAKSHLAISRRLRALGFTDAADQTQVEYSEGDDDLPADPTPLDGDRDRIAEAIRKMPQAQAARLRTWWLEEGLPGDQHGPDCRRLTPEQVEAIDAQLATVSAAA